LTSAPARQTLQSVGGRHSQVLQSDRAIKHSQFTQGYLLNV
jgi:hypothetical protein